ncbi:hypothetical protein MPER_05272 [Moniliophthora perniciosa FA553]|nr:hypothetical protein MPER_05272 [Moniliophthora perniciosa FA553]
MCMFIHGLTAHIWLINIQTWGQDSNANPGAYATVLFEIESKSSASILSIPSTKILEKGPLRALQELDTIAGRNQQLLEQSLLHFFVIPASPANHYVSTGGFRPCTEV